MAFPTGDGRSIGILLAGFFVVSTILTTPILFAAAQLAPPAYTQLTDADVRYGDLNQRTVVYQVTADGTIPKKPDTYIDEKRTFGYGWWSSFDPQPDPPGSPAVVATLGNIGDPHVIGDPGVKWNVQTVNLTKPNGADVCISSVSDPNQRITIRANTLTAVLKSTDAAVDPVSWGKIANSFELVLDTASCDPSSTTGLKVVLIG